MTRPARLRRALSTVLLAVSATALLAVCLLSGHTRYELATVDSGSMAPAIPAGSLVVLHSEPVADLRAGQVISYRAPTRQHQVLTHRVTAVERAADGTVSIRTRGDANPGEDPWRAVLVEPTTWRVTASAPRVGTAAALVRDTADRPVVAALGLVVALLLIWGPPERLRRALAARSRHPRAARAAGRAGAAVAVAAAVTAGSTTAADALWTTSASRGHSATTTRLLTPSLTSANGTCLLNAAAVDVAWTSPSDRRTGVRLERRLSSSTTWSTVADLPAATTSYTDRSVAYANRYSYRVTHTRYAWTSAPSAELQTASLAPCIVTIP